MHFYLEHYSPDKKEIEVDAIDTWSYYGNWNWLIYNVGYHKEHHDDTKVAGYYLPKFRSDNQEKYKDGVATHDSYVKVMFGLLTKRIDLYRHLYEPKKEQWP